MRASTRLYQRNQLVYIEFCLVFDFNIVEMEGKLLIFKSEGFNEFSFELAVWKYKVIQNNGLTIDWTQLFKREHADLLE